MPSHVAFGHVLGHVPLVSILLQNCTRDLRRTKQLQQLLAITTIVSVRNKLVTTRPACRMQRAGFALGYLKLYVLSFATTTHTSITPPAIHVFDTIRKMTIIQITIVGDTK